MSGKNVSLGQVSELLIGFAFKSSGFLDDAAEGIRLVRGDNVQQGNIRWGDKAKKWALGDFELLSRYQLRLGDVLLAMDRPVVGGGLKLAWVTQNDLPSLLVQRVCCVRGKAGIADTLYLRYVLAEPRFTGHIDRITTGANIPHISGKDIAAFSFALPPLDEQRRIASAIAAYDDLIENNQRRIKLLEEAAQRLYREWFVALRFPGHERVKVVDGVPQGWERKQLDSICYEVKDLADPNQIDPATPYLSMEHMQPRSICLDHWETANKVGSTKAEFKKRDVLFGKIRPYFHKVGLAQTSGITSTDVIVLRPKKAELLAMLLMIVSADDFVAHAAGTSNGSKMPRANWQVLKNWGILVPPNEIVARFESAINPLLDQMEHLSQQSRLSRQARDALLPRLMSGALVA